MKTRLLAAMAVVLVVSNSYSKDLIDPLQSPEHESRVVQRGEWKFENGTVSCVSDPELYKKYKNHGPIIRWSGDFKTVDAEFEFKASQCNRVVFTLNGSGHVFRAILAGTPSKKGGRPIASRLIAWAEKSSKQNKGEAKKPTDLPDVKSINGKWVRLKVEIKGDVGKLTIGDFETEWKHAAMERPKKEMTLSFASGELAIRNVKISTP